MRIDTGKEGGEGNPEITTFCLSAGGRNLAVCLRVGTKEPTYLINLY